MKPSSTIFRRANRTRCGGCDPAHRRKVTLLPARLDHERVIAHRVDTMRIELRRRAVLQCGGRRLRSANREPARHIAVGIEHAVESVVHQLANVVRRATKLAAISASGTGCRAPQKKRAQEREMGVVSVPPDNRDIPYRVASRLGRSPRPSRESAAEFRGAPSHGLRRGVWDRHPCALKEFDEQVVAEDQPRR